MRTCIKIVGLGIATATAALAFAGPASARAVPTAQHAALPSCAVDSPGGLIGLSLPILSPNYIGRCA